MPDDIPTPARGMTAQEFFAAGLEGASMTAAHCSTRIAYTTIHRASRGIDVRADKLRELERWSLSVEGARSAGVYLSAAATMAVSRPPAKADDVDDIETADTIPPGAA